MATCEQNLPQKRKERAMPTQKDGQKKRRKENYMKKIVANDQVTKTGRFYKRKPTLMKKADELSTLCDVSVCLLCFGPDGKLDVWPNKEKVTEILMVYRALDDRLKKEFATMDFWQNKKKKLERKKEKKVSCLMSRLSRFLDGLSGNSLIDKVNDLEKEVTMFKKRIELLLMKEKLKNAIQIPDGEVSPVDSMLYHPGNQVPDANLQFPGGCSLGKPEGIENSETCKDFVAEDENEAFRNLPKADPTIPEKREDMFWVTENPDDYLIPFDHQHQISCIHDDLPISVWKPPQALVESVGSSESNNIVSSYHFTAPGSENLAAQFPGVDFDFHY